MASHLQNTPFSGREPNFGTPQGNAFNWFGYGLILPFEIIYLHQFRGFSTATSGLVLAAILGAGTVATPLDFGAGDGVRRN